MRRSELILVLLAGCTCAGPEHHSPAGTPPGSATTAATAETGGSTGETGLAQPVLGWKAMDVGYVHACGLLTDHRTVCWGYDDFTTDVPSTPFQQISVFYGGCGLTLDGGVECWCPSALSEDAKLPCGDVPAGNNFVRVENGVYWACAEDTEHLLHCWGHYLYATGVPAEPVTSWSIEVNYGCAVLSDGRVTCWGDTDIFAAADPDPALAPPPENKYTQVSAGSSHACALDTEGEAHCWGSTGLREAFPAAPPGPWASLVSWNQITCGLRGDGSAECWYHLPGMLDEWFIPDERWAQMSLGEWDGCGVTLDGRAVCFPAPYDSEGEQYPPDLADLAAQTGSDTAGQ